jgi:hypothetical protein
VQAPAVATIEADGEARELGCADGQGGADASRRASRHAPGIRPGSGRTAARAIGKICAICGIGRWAGDEFSPYRDATIIDAAGHRTGARVTWPDA